ncbi:hypothetical protein I4U23_020083 [Adineta vaga]|nr:hypothetical protein I4U23_020083 [Adineta vaga]
MSNNGPASILFEEKIFFPWQKQIINILCYILVLLGIIGNVLGLFIFSLSRRSWRTSSMYAFLATCSSITNLLCVIRYSALLHSSIRYIIHELVGNYWWFCKFYELTFSFRVISSWITLFWMFERLMCVSTRLKLIFNRCKSIKMKFIVPSGLIIIILICVIGPPVYMFQPQMLIHTNNNGLNSTSIRMICVVNLNASKEWQRYFHQLNLGFNHFTIRCLFSELIPTGVIILFNCIINYQLFQTHHRLSKRISHRSYKRQSETRSWMNIVLVLHSLLFLASLFSHIVGHFIAREAHESWWVILSVLINCSLNFYVYCLSGKAFRNEIGRLIQRCQRQCLCQQQIYHDRQQVKSSFQMNNL